LDDIMETNQQHWQIIKILLKSILWNQIN
jgi:hypothetical protein